MQELQPQIAELLRTCVRPPSLFLRVAYVEFIDVKHDRHEQVSTGSTDDAQRFDEIHRFAVSFVLTDGKLMIQALLHRKLSGLRDAADIAVGDFLDIRTFVVRQSTKLNGQGHIVYLAIEDCHFLLQPSHESQKPDRDEQEAAELRSRKRSRGFSADTAPCWTESLGEDGPTGSCLRSPPIKRPKLQDSQLFVSADNEDQDVCDPKQNTHGLLNADVSVIRGSKTDQTMAKMESQNIYHNKSEHLLGKRHNKTNLSSTFGARTIVSDDEDDDNDFFEEAAVNLTLVNKRRTALQKLDSSVLSRSRASMNEAKPIDHILMKPTVTSAFAQVPTLPDPPAFQTPSQMWQRELEEELDAKARERFAQPPQQPPRRDGTFALSQTPTPLPQQNRTSLAPQPKRAQPTAPMAPTQQTLLPAPPFHTLRSLRNPPPSQQLPNKNYTLTTLAYISWTGTSLIHRAGSPFPPKRHLKIVDPSLMSSRPPSRDDKPLQRSGSSNFTAQSAFQDAVTVAVYIDAANFKPVAGTLAVFRGLVMQRLGNGDIILNAYGRLKEQRFDDGAGVCVTNVVDVSADNGTASDTHWFITDEVKIRALGYGSEFDYYREWWNEKQQPNRVAQA